ncbi:SAM-dependent DNA methyltransferase [Candidatus Desantisbacteria bacterium]|nr:SAM-dependent DNA methyltransferase [Candidatus Desantisbacteria bacterium]
MSITTLIKMIQDIMRKDVGVDGDAQRISQIGWMLFLKIFDDKEKEWEITIPDYKSPIPSRFQWSNWARNPEGMTGEELIEFINIELFPKLKTLATKAGSDERARVVGAVFEDGYNYMKSGTLLRQVVNIIQEDLDFNSSTDRHMFNDIYEKILKDLQSAGNAGEYYTPRAVTQFMVEMINPRLGEKVLDPACGTGGFLANTIEHLRKQVKNKEHEKQLQDSINGVEKKPLPHLLATTNMLLHGIEVPSKIRHDNTLAKPLISYGPEDRVHCIITNPTFGGMEEDGVESNFPKSFQTRETADLFLVLIIHLLKPNGKAGIVLPDGTLFGEGIKTRIKEKLLEECNLHTIVRLPNGVFSPYTGIKTNLLFFTKGEKTKNIWYYEHPYPEGCKSYNKTKPMSIEEFEPEKKWWKKRAENEQAWKVSIEQIKANNYNLDIKNPNTQAEVHADPKDILKDYNLLSKEIEQIRNKLKKELSTAWEKVNNEFFI